MESDQKIKYPLTERVMTGFKVARRFDENEKPVTCIDFSSSGEHLLTSSDDDRLTLFNCNHGIIRRQLTCQKYGVVLAHFTHTADTAVHASRKGEHILRYLSVTENRYIRYFKGHEAQVTALQMNPKDDTIVSASLDKTARLWDIRKSTCLQSLKFDSNVLTRFDPTGVALAVAEASRFIRLYDTRNLCKGPFSTFQYSNCDGVEWNSIVFSPDGEQILIQTCGNLLKTVNAYDGRGIKNFCGLLNNKTGKIQAGFSPDSHYVISGSSNGFIYVWNAKTSERVTMLKASPLPIQCVRFDPNYLMMVSTCRSTIFWTPTFHSLEKDNYNPHSELSVPQNIGMVNS